MTMKEFSAKLQQARRSMGSTLRFLLSLTMPVGIFSAIYLLGISAILRANFNYMDDMGRACFGYGAWYFSRPLSNILALFLHADDYLTDISPLPQILAAVLMAAASVVVLYAVTGKKRFTLWEYVSVLPLGLSPYFLQCLSFKYDAPYMAISVLAAVAPLVMQKYPPPLVLLLLTIFCTVVMCCTYQASTGIYPMLVILLVFVRWLRRENSRDIFWFAAVSAAGYCAGIGIYKIFIMAPKATYDYVDSSLPPISQLFSHTFQNYKRFFSYILSDFDYKWLLLAALLAAAFILIAVRDSKRNKLLSLLAATGVLCMLLLTCFGGYPLLTKTLFSPRAMYGFGALLAFLAVFVASAKKAFSAKLVSLALSWAFFVFAFTYGNALYAQKMYTDFRVEEVIQSIADDEIFHSCQPILTQVDGSIGLAPIVKNVPTDSGILRRLIPTTFGSSSGTYSAYGFAHYYGLPELVFDSSVDLATFDLPVIDETVYHRVYGDKDMLLIELK